MYSSDGYEIMVDRSLYMERYALLKISFGKKFYIVRAKLVKQFIDSLGKQLRTGINKRGVDETSLLYHIVRHIIAARPLHGICTVIETFDAALPLIKAEQLMLDKYSKDLMCLNNNEQAYVPIGNDFMTESEKEKFLIWFEKRGK
jgi:hypothetical protein